MLPSRVTKLALGKRTWDYLKWHRTANITNPSRTVSECLINSIRHLISEGADPNETDKEGNTLVHLIASGRFIPSAAFYTPPIDGLDELSDKEYEDGSHVGVMRGSCGSIWEYAEVMLL